MRQNAYLAK